MVWILQTLAILSWIHWMEVDSDRTGLNVPSGQKAAIVVSREESSSLALRVSAVASSAAASGSGAFKAGSTVMPLVASLVSATQR